MKEEEVTLGQLLKYRNTVLKLRDVYRRASSKYYQKNRDVIKAKQLQLYYEKKRRSKSRKEVVPNNINENPGSQAPVPGEGHVYV